MKIRLTGKSLLCSLWLVVLATTAQAATIVVNSSDETVIADDGFCNMTEAVQAANSNTASGSSPGECAAGQLHPVVDEITFAAEILPALFFSIAAYELTDSVAIRGPHRDLVTFGGSVLGRTMVVQNSALDGVFVISDVTIEGSFLNASQSIAAGPYGGAIVGRMLPGTTLTIERVNFINNWTQGGGGALGLFGAGGAQTTIRDSLFDGNFVQKDQVGETVVGGGAIFIGGNEHLTIENSTFVDNYVFNQPLTQPESDGDGGAILMRSNIQLSPSSLAISHSTFSNNHTVGVGGAIALGGPGFPLEHGELIIKHSTLVENTADSNDDLLPIPGGGAIWSASSTPLSLFNSIVALNIDNANVPAPSIDGAVTSFGYNFIGNNASSTATFPAGQPNANNDWVGVQLVELDPQLAPLADNGGPTPTHLPLANSLVLDQGKCNAKLHDQRYRQNAGTGKREFDLPGIANALNGCDIGAVERDTPDSSNPLPNLMADVYTVLEDQTLDVAATGLLANDSDNDPLVVISAGVQLTTGVGGIAIVGIDGGFSFTASDADANGSATFTYTASDGINHSEAAVTIDIIPVNDPPGFTPSTSTITAIPGQPVTVPAWATNISAGPADESGQSLLFVLAGDNQFVSQFPEVDATSGDLTFTLAPTATGSQIYEVLLLDDGGSANGGDHSSAIELLTLQADGNVNQPPVANDQNVSVDENSTVNITLTGSDADGDALTYMLVSPPAHGSLSGSAPNITYTPDSDYFGSDSFTFKVNDGTVDSPVATVSITVNAVTPPQPDVIFSDSFE